MDDITRGCGDAVRLACKNSRLRGRTEARIRTLVVAYDLVAVHAFAFL